MTGQRLKLIRESKNITQHELAVRTGFTQSKISKLERGSIKLKLDDLILIAGTLSVPITDLLDEEKQSA
ncbi:hypothetical protein JIMMER1_62 [Brevibacillus phage Jimmer1]|uniref:HTH cro/C1-type domain-containing protein n=2 Tax=Jimmervirus jimmer TaxID=1984789 RepID=S5MNA2_9CAUD|nr:transcriptional regulator [Brevibacillus phage Jimmer1]YP_009606489.1 transcriptional regulator [Brevibacillus phage Jimmer2]AGR47240.2 hypothetical protein JIMMER2_62 [Brevibacillus phage Jimmer2]AGR47338.2 hypothetical protein JIMMER1_62 [Brevibacillus phage Jimmer1]